MAEDEKLDDFLAELQGDCLNDAADLVAELREMSSKLFSDRGTVEAMMKVCHNLKGNLQAVGYLSCSTFVHNLETALLKLQEPLSSGRVESDEEQVVSFFVYDILESLDSYIDALKKSGEDKESFLQEREHSVVMLEAWEPKASAEKSENVHVVSEGDSESAVQNEVGSADANPVGEAERQGEASPKEVGEKSKSQMASKKKEVAVEKRLENFLLCFHDERFFAIPLKSVTEIIKTQKMNRLPVEREDVKGIINLRGDALPIMDLDHLFDANGAQKRSNDYCVIAEMSGGRFGFEVQDVQQVLEFDRNEFRSASELDSEDGPSVIKEYAILDEDLVLVLELERALAA